MNFRQPMDMGTYTVPPNSLNASSNDFDEPASNADQVIFYLWSCPPTSIIIDVLGFQILITPQFLSFYFIDFSFCQEKYPLYSF